MDMWLSCLVLFYVINSSVAASGQPEEKSIYDFFSNNTNKIVQFIWKHEAVSSCNIPKPPEKSIEDKTFITYNFNQVLCIVLADASLRYLNFSDYSFQSQGEEDSFKKIVEQSPEPEKFCDKMKDTNWTTYIEENIKWLQMFDTTMNNEALCHRYCAADFINPLCAYTLWLDMAVKEREHPQELLPKTDASHFVPLPIARSSPRKSEPNKPPPEQQSAKHPQQPRAHLGPHLIVSANPNDPQVIVNQESAAHFPHSAALEPVNVSVGSGVEVDVTNHVTSKGHEPVMEGDMSTVPETPRAKDANFQTSNKQIQGQKDVPLNVATKLTTGLKPSKPTDPVMEGKPLRVSLPNPGKVMKGSLMNLSHSSNDVSGRRPDSNTQSNVPHVEQQAGNENPPALVTSAFSEMNHGDKGKLGSAAKQSPKHGTNAKAAESGEKENGGDFTLHKKEHTLGTALKTNVEAEDKDAEGMSDGALQVEPNNHEQKDREEALEEDVEGMERQEEQSPEGDVPTTEPRFGGENEDPVNGRNTSPKNFEYDGEDEAVMRVNEGEQEKVTQNDAGAGMYVHDRFVDAEDSHFFAYFMTMIILCIIGYLIFHNKQKILALALEGRVRKGNRRRPSTSGYRKLDSNLEEAVTSNCAGASVTHVIY